MMRRFLAWMAIGVVAVVVFALVGTTLPEGNPLRDAAEGLRAIGSNIADGFGGGYGRLSGG